MVRPLTVQLIGVFVLNHIAYVHSVSHRGESLLGIMGWEVVGVDRRT